MRVQLILMLMMAVATARADTPPAELSRFLVVPAARALAAHDTARAIPLYRALAAARGPDSAEAAQLTELLAGAGAAGKLATTPDLPDARTAVAAAKRHEGADAILLLRMAYALAPELPGVLRDLAAALAAEHEDPGELFRAELLARPFGANADYARKQLGASALGTLAVGSSLPCAEIWINREKLPAKLPAAGVAVAPGTYKGLCYAPKYEMALFEYATVEAGQPARMQFDWAIVVNQLAHPFGRIAVENPKAPGVMIDLGITSPEIGVAVAGDHRKLEMVLTDDSGQRRESRTVQLDPGQRLVIQW